MGYYYYYLFIYISHIWGCPLEEEINGMFCLNPPKKLLLLMYIQEELDKNGDMRTVSFDEKHLPDVDWCLKALSALDPLH